MRFQQLGAEDALASLHSGLQRISKSRGAAQAGQERAGAGARYARPNGPAVDQPLLTGIFFSLALTSGGFGTVTVRTPLPKVALT